MRERMNMAFNMWNNSHGFTKDFIRECERTFARRLNEAKLDLLFNEVSFLDLTPEIYESQKAKHKNTLEDLVSYLNYLEQCVMKKLCDSTPHIVLLLEIRDVTFGFHQLHLQCLDYIDKVNNLDQLSTEQYEKDQIVFGAFLQSFQAKFKLLIERIFKVHAHKECDLQFNMFLDQYTRLKYQIWHDIEKIGGEVNDTIVNEIEHLKKSLYDIRRRLLYPLSRDLDMNSLFEIFSEVEEFEHMNIYDKFQEFALNLQSKKEEMSRVSEALIIQSNTQVYETLKIELLNLTEYEHHCIALAMFKVHFVQNTCFKLGQVVAHIFFKLSYLMKELSNL